MRAALSIFAVLSFILGCLLLFVAQSAIHEIEAACGFIIFAIAGSGAAILEHLESLGKSSEKQTALLEQIARHARPTISNAEVTPPSSSANYIKDDPGKTSITTVLLVLVIVGAIVAIIIAIATKR